MNAEEQPPESSNEREQARHEIREKILNAAMKLYRESGLANITMRNIAREVNYSPSTIYLYFESKEDILHHIRRNGFQQLLENLQTIAHIPDALERINAYGYMYFKFAMSRQEYFDFMLRLPLSVSGLPEDDCLIEELGCFYILEGVVEMCIKEGVMREDIDPRYIAAYLLAGWHGITLMVLEKRLEHFTDQTDAETHFNQFTEMQINAMRTLQPGK